MCKEQQSHHSTSSHVVLFVLYCNRSQKTSQRVKNNSHATRLRLVSYFLFFTRCDVICDLLQYTHTEKCYLFVNYEIHFLHNYKLGLRSCRHINVHRPIRHTSVTSRTCRIIVSFALSSKPW